MKMLKLLRPGSKRLTRRLDSLQSKFDKQILKLEESVTQNHSLIEEIDEEIAKLQMQKQEALLNIERASHFKTSLQNLLGKPQNPDINND